MKYIDADALKAEIERLKDQLIRGACAAQIEMETNCKDEAYNEVLSLIDSIQQEQPELPGIERAEYYYHKGVYEGLSKGRADALKVLEESMKVKANPAIVIKQQEHLEVDLSEETITKEFHIINDRCFNEGIEGWQKEKLIAHHFYELGLNARKEESK